MPRLPEDPKVVSTREGVHNRIQAEMYHNAKEAEALVEEQLEALPGWNKVPNVMMETREEDGITDAATKRKREEVAQICRKWQKEDDIRRSLQFRREFITQHGSILRIVMSLNRMRMTGKGRINDSKSLRWCFVAD